MDRYIKIDGYRNVIYVVPDVLDYLAKKFNITYDRRLTVDRS